MLDRGLKTLTYYAIDVETSYNLVLGWPWIHTNMAVLTILHQYMKYTDETEKYTLQFPKENHLRGWKGVSLTPSYTLKIFEALAPLQNDYDNDKVVYTKLKVKTTKDELKSTIISLDNLVINNITNDVGE